MLLIPGAQDGLKRPDIFRPEHPQRAQCHPGSWEQPEVGSRALDLSGQKEGSQAQPCLCAVGLNRAIVVFNLNPSRIVFKTAFLLAMGSSHFTPPLFLPKDSLPRICKKDQSRAALVDMAAGESPGAGVPDLPSAPHRRP